MSLLFRSLQCIGRGDYGRQYPKLFSQYMPGILPSMVDSDLAVHIAEICMLQSTLLAQGGAGAMQQGQKRELITMVRHFVPLLRVNNKQQCHQTCN
jgi:hypothetical protein